MILNIELYHPHLYLVSNQEYHNSNIESRHYLCLLSPDCFHFETQATEHPATVGTDRPGKVGITIVIAITTTLAILKH